MKIKKAALVGLLKSMGFPAEKWPTAKLSNRVSRFPSMDKDEYSANLSGDESKLFGKLTKAMEAEEELEDLGEGQGQREGERGTGQAPYGSGRGRRQAGDHRLHCGVFARCQQLQTRQQRSVVGEVAKAFPRAGRNTNENDD